MILILQNDFKFLILYGFIATIVQWVFLVKNMNLLTTNFESILLDLILPIMNAFFFIIITIINSFVGINMASGSTSNGITILISNILCYIGFTISLTAIIQLRKYFTVFAEANGLIKQGLYKYVRHPIYTGYIIVTLALLLINHSNIEIAISGLYIFLFNVRASREESLLITAFGDDYSLYKESTGKFFIK